MQMYKIVFLQFLVLHLIVLNSNFFLYNRLFSVFISPFCRKSGRTEKFSVACKALYFQVGARSSVPATWHLFFLVCLRRSYQVFVHFVDYVTTASFQIFTNSQFISFPTIS